MGVWGLSDNGNAITVLSRRLRREYLIDCGEIQIAVTKDAPTR